MLEYDRCVAELGLSPVFTSFPTRLRPAFCQRRGLEVSADEAAEVAAAIRSSLMSQGESFAFETVPSDPVGQKVDALASYVPLG